MVVENQSYNVCMMCVVKMLTLSQGLVVSLFSLGSLVGALLGGPLSDWAGRRATLVGAALLAASGIIIQCSAIAIWQD